MDRAEEIAAVPGVDMLMLGPADFTVLTGIPGEFSHPTVAAAVEKVAQAARNTGKHWAATCGSVEVADDDQTGCPAHLSRLRHRLREARARSTASQFPHGIGPSL